MSHEKHSPKSSLTLENVRRLLSLLSKEKTRMLFALLFIGIATILQSAVLTLQRPIYNMLTEGVAWGRILPYILAIPAIVLLASAIQYVANLFLCYGTQNILSRLRAAIFAHLQSLPIPFFDRTSHGELMSTLTNDVDRLQEFYGNTWSSIVSSSLQIIVFFIIMTTLSWQLMIVNCILLIFPLLCSKLIAKRSAALFVTQQQKIAALNGFVEEYVEGQKIVKAYTHEQVASADFAEINRELQKSSSKAQTYATVLFPILGNFSYISYAILGLLGAYLALSGYIDIGALMTFLTMSRNFSQPIGNIAQLFNNVAQALAGAERINKLFKEESEIDDGDVCSEAGNWLIPQADGSIERRLIRGEIVFKNVDFSYVKGQPILKDISLWAKPTQRIALVGSTGAGKTTITNLINRFYEIDEGLITYDGIDIRRIKKADLRRGLSMVLQETHLFKGTIRENLRFGRLSATDEEIEAAARSAHAHHFISELEKGYDTELLPDGSNLSQGQRQLLAIARAAIARPYVLILDEATSSVDTRTEKLIEQGMDHLMKQATTFAIAHRLSTVRTANAIMVLEHGVIIERGTHDELMEQKGTYYDLNMGTVQLT